MKPATESSGNVFEDLGFANSKELLAKAELAREAYLIVKKRGLTETTAASLLGMKQPDVSLLVRGLRRPIQTSQDSSRFRGKVSCENLGNLAS